MQTLKTDTDILIAGAGPAGLALAAELTRRGTNPLIVDRQPAGANTSRACVVHARTMEVLEPLGVTEDLVAHGIKVPIFRVRDRDRALLTIDFSEIPSRYPFTLMIPRTGSNVTCWAIWKRSAAASSDRANGPLRGDRIARRGALERGRDAENRGTLAGRLRRHAQQGAGTGRGSPFDRRERTSRVSSSPTFTWTGR